MSNPGLGSGQASDRVTVLVFKDHFAARTFQVPLSWISRLGLILGFAAVLTLGALFLAAKFYRDVSKADVNRVQALELELGELKEIQKTLESKLASADAQLEAARAQSGAGQPPPTVIPASASARAASTPAASGAADALFTALAPAASQQQIPDPSTRKIKVSQPKATWRGGNRLRVQFNIQYVATDGSYQSGHIVILARGPETLAAYPDGVLNDTATGPLIQPRDGEYFSVSRFREVKADLGPFKSRAAITLLEVMILDTTGRILLLERVKPESPPAAAPPSAQPQATPQPASADAPATKPVTPKEAPGASYLEQQSPTEYIEPGVDR